MAVVVFEPSDDDGSDDEPVYQAGSAFSAMLNARTPEAISEARNAMSPAEFEAELASWRQRAPTFMTRPQRKCDSARPSWEPRLKTSRSDAESIERGPSSEEQAMDSLLQQGCQWPPKHFREDHECRVPQLRLRALRQIECWKKSRPLVELMTERLPDELVLEILEYVALDTQRLLHLYITGGVSQLREAAKVLIGDARTADQLVPLAEQAIMEYSLIRLDIDFRRSGDGPEKVAILPAYTLHLPHSLRRLQIRMEVEIPTGRQQYPTPIYSATSGMTSLHTQLRGLRDLYLLVVIRLNHHHRDTRNNGPILSTACRQGFTGTSTFRQAIAEMVEAARHTMPNVNTFIELRYEHDYEWYAPPTWKPLPDELAVRVDDRDVIDVVKEAEDKWS